MYLSNLSSFSRVFRQPPASAMFVKYASSFHRQPPPPTAFITRDPHIPHTRKQQRDQSYVEWKALNESKQTLRSQSDVGLSLAKCFLQDRGEGSNVVFSPLSIQVLLSLIGGGCSGPSLDELLPFLKLNSIDELNQFGSKITSHVMAGASSKGGPKISLANGVWVNQLLSLKHSFKHIVDTYYKATLRHADFTKGEEVISEGNSWVKEQTKGLITDILPRGSVNSLTNVILANAPYFKGDWVNEFYPLYTKEEEFYLVDGTSIHTPFMTTSEKQYIASFDGFKVLTMPYRKGRHDQRQFSMSIFLPNDKYGLLSLIQKLDSKSGFIDHHIPQRRVKVSEIKIPKFKFSFEVEASNLLQKLGLVLPFTIEEGLSEMVESETNTFVSNIFHKACIEVNEKGTKAAAVSVTLGLGACRNMPLLNMIDFVADHPFLFAIRENVTRTLLFVGTVLNPTL